MDKEKSCGAVVINNEGGELKTLLIKHNAGHWSFPKGHVEGSETEIETAAREIKEETGLLVKIDDHFRKISTYSPKKGVVKDVIYFIAEKTGGILKPQTEEIQQCCWLDFDSAEKMITFEADREIFKCAGDYINLNYCR